MMKKGIALIITLGMIMLISAVALTMLAIVEKSQTAQTQIERRTQNQAFLKSFSQLLDAMTAQANSREAVSMMMGVFPGLSDETNRIIFDIQLHPLQGALNINVPIDDAYKKLYYSIFNRHELRDPDQMIRLIADITDSNNTQDQEFDRTYGAMQGRHALEQLSQEYYALTEDEKIFTITWEDYFYFGAFNDKRFLDCDYMSQGLIEALELRTKEPILDTQAVCEDFAEDQNETMQAYHIRPYKKDDAYVIEARMEYLTPTVKGGFSFNYDLKNKGMTHFKEIQ